MNLYEDLSKIFNLRNIWKFSLLLDLPVDDHELRISEYKANEYRIDISDTKYYKNLHYFTLIENVAKQIEHNPLRQFRKAKYSVMNSDLFSDRKTVHAAVSYKILCVVEKEHVLFWLKYM